ncbi:MULTISPECIES: flagellar hook-associated protein FlgK [Methylomonas]|uniref:Flagellar hook-associated protein 1 n=1 Tax=Methylomonas koyamae TaxID=702114 RepID=A0A177PIC4_9GAMM|nr:flagellar hook-associated protein FlgK [Methylomonas koyamae]OAI29149.1 flagellar biosynthesis protein FlgK [Methylomonas koyamae]
MGLGILDTALSGLTAFQRSLETTSNNISNVSTEGYSRQRVETATRREQYTGSGYVGSGVSVVNITRSYDQFITGQVRSSTSAYHDVDSFYTLSSQIDNITADDTTGLAPAMKSFFDAVDTVANDPTSIPARQTLLTQASSLTQQFNTLNTRFGELRDQVNTNLETDLTEINGYAKALADLNVKIVADIGRASGREMPNDLLDQRDLLLNKIAEKVDVNFTNQTDGSINVFIGNGQPLVLGNSASQLSLQSSATDSTHKEILLNGQDISGLISGGELYGNLRFRDQVLDPAQKQLGTLAMGLATEFNSTHQAGFDLNGDPGLAFFDLGSPVVQVTPHAADDNLLATASFVAPSSSANLDTSYRISITGTSPNAYTLTNLSSNTSQTGLDDTTLATAAAALGFSITFSGGSLTSGDTFDLSPSFNAAGTLKVNSAITNPKQIAAASSAAGVPGDNSNALALADLETKTLMQNGKASFTQVYSQLVADVGSQTHAASVNRTAQDTLLKQATSAKETVSGVNLDEEAANLIKFQNAYAAAAKAVSVASTLFDTLIGAVR